MLLSLLDLAMTAGSLLVVCIILCAVSYRFGARVALVALAGFMTVLAGLSIVSVVQARHELTNQSDCRLGVHSDGTSDWYCDTTVPPFDTQLTSVHPPQ